VPAGIAHIEIARITDVLADVPEAHAAWLSESELARLAAIRFDGRRTQYLSGHWLARVLLARAYGGTPARWQLLERKSQPPRVIGSGDELYVSISHGTDWVAVAVADAAIGIDLEQRPRTLDATIEPLLLNSDEVAGSLDADSLLQRWVAKEAWIKRHAGSALPARLTQLRVKSTTREHADVRIDSHAEFHFGLAIASDCTVNRQCSAELTSSAAFSIIDQAVD